MIFTAYSFIFFVVFGLFLFASVPARFRPAVLLLLSLFWYATWKIPWVLGMTGITAINYVLIRLKKSRSAGQWPGFFPALIAFNVLIFVGLKLVPVVFPSAEASFSPFGLSFYYLALLALIIDESRSAAKPPGATEFLLLPSFFPALVGGPIQRSRAFFSELRNLPAPGFVRMMDGALIFSYGFLKRVFLMAGFDYFAKVTLAHAPEGPWFIVAAGLANTFLAYLTFSSFCDMGRGAAYCFGINLGPNFRPFYYAKNPIDLWLRWNISLGAWLRDYVGFPLMLKYGRSLGQGAITFFSFVLLGLWHGLTFNWVMFGVFNGLLVVLYHQFQTRVFVRKPQSLKWSGIILVWLLYIGNGIFQGPSVLNFFASIPRGFIPTPPVSFFLALPIFAVFEFYQERTNNLDFYLKAPLKYRALVFALIAGLFLWTLHESFSVSTFDRPPVYFKL